MNALEKLVHGQLENYPAIKKLVTQGYQCALSILPYTEVLPDITMTAPGCFYGFHDKSPWSRDDKRLLSHRARSASRSRSRVQIGTVTVADAQFQALGDTALWSAQQGSELQWCGDNIWFNDQINDLQSAQVIDQTGELLTQYELPVAAIDPTGARFASFCFARLARSMVGYGYATPNLQQENTAKLKLCSINTGAAETVYTAPKDTSTNFHVISHTGFSPSGRFLAFYLRTAIACNLFSTQLLVFDAQNKELKTYQDVTDCSHYTWIDDSQIFAFCKSKTATSWSYQTIDIHTGHCQQVMPLAKLTDGHPQYCPLTKRVVSDSYPDRQRLQRLYVFDLQQGLCDEVARLRIPMRFTGADRCDFHPRWSHDGSMICIDSAHSGQRSLVVVKLQD